MLLKSSITNIVVHSEEWFAGRLAKFTSSEIHFLCGKEGIGQTGRKYILRKLGEELTGIPCRDEISTAATAHGHEHEPFALKAFMKKMGVEFLVTQKLIVPVGSRYGSTPDGIIVRKESIDKLSYQVEPVEAKCPSSYDAYLELWECETPEKIKKVEKKYYWQVLDQMHVCDALVGYLVIFQPYFKAGNLRIVQFNKMDLMPDFKLLVQRKEEAVKTFDELRTKLITAA